MHNAFRLSWYSTSTFLLHNTTTYEVADENLVNAVAVVTVSKQKFKNAHLDYFFWTLFCVWSTNFVQVLLRKYSFHCKYISVFYVYFSLCIHEYKWIVLSLLYLKNIWLQETRICFQLAASIPVWSMSMFGTVWGNSLEGLGRWISHISFPAIKEK